MNLELFSSSRIHAGLSAALFCLFLGFFEAYWNWKRAKRAGSRLSFLDFLFFDSFTYAALLWVGLPAATGAALALLYYWWQGGTF